MGDQVPDLPTPGGMPKSKLSVKNTSPLPVRVCVSKSNGLGNDDFFEIPPGGTEKWSRYVAIEVTIKASDIDTVSHRMFASTGCNQYEVDGSEITRSGQTQGCL